MNPFSGKYRPLLLITGLLICGCNTLREDLPDESKDTACLKQAMDANHKATVAIFKETNERELPFRIEDGVNATSFSKDQLTTLAPADIAAWDKVLEGLDSYCEALDCLTNGKEVSDFESASESFGGNMQSLAKAAKMKGGSYVSGAATAVTALGSILIEMKANSDVHAIAKAADPQFHQVIEDLVTALGYKGDPPEAASDGLLATYEIHYATQNAPLAKEYKSGSIAGFDQMTPEKRREAIKGLIAWLGAEQEHDDFVKAVHDLVDALRKVETAHHDLGSAPKETTAAAFAQLQAEVKDVQAIYNNLKKS
jgi:hypothetical protein